MVTTHISRNLRRYAVGAGATGAAVVAAKPAGKQAGKASVGKSDPYYDMNRRAGESIFHSRKSKIDSSRLKKSGMREAGAVRGTHKVRKIAGAAFLKRNSKNLKRIGISGAVGTAAVVGDRQIRKTDRYKRHAGIKEAGSRTFGKGLGRAGRYAKLKLQPDEGLGKAIGSATSKTLKSIKPGTKQIVPAAATAGAAAIVGKRAKSGAEQGRYDKRRSGTQRGYTDAYKKTYGRQEGIDESIASKALRSVGRNIAKGAGETASSPAGRRNMRRAGHDAGSGAAEGAMKHLEKPLRQINRSVRIAGGSIGGGAAVGGIGIGAGQATRGRKERKESIDEANVASGVRKIVGKLKSVQAHPTTHKTQSAIKSSGRGLAALNLAVLGTTGATMQVKKLRGKEKQDEGLAEGRIN